MRITNKDIANDADFVIQELKQAEVEIPSFWQCSKIGFFVMIAFTLWQMFIAAINHDRMFGVDDAFFLSGGVGFIIFLGIASARSKYLSLPDTVRQKSLIVNLIKTKARCYCLIWGAICLLSGIFVIWLQLIAAVSHGIALASLVIVWFIALIDLGRYDLSLLSAAITAWRSGGDMSSIQQPAQPAATPGATHHTEQ